MRSCREAALAVPRASSLAGYVVNEAAVMMHVLMPAASETEFITMDRRHVTLDKEHGVLITGRGFRESRSVGIQFEEVFYNADFQPFTIFCIEEPLEGGLSFLFATDDDEFESGGASGGADGSSGGEETGCGGAGDGGSESSRDLYTLDVFPITHTYPEYVSLLTRLASASLVGSIVPALCEFNQTPINPQNNHAYTVRRLRALCDATLTELEVSVDGIREAIASEPQYQVQLQVAVESFVLGGVNTHLFAVLCQYHARQERRVQAGIAALGAMGLDEMDVRPELAGCELGEASRMVELLRECRTPLEKKMVVRATLQTITLAVETHLEAGAEPLNADDMLWLVVYVLCRAEVSHLYAHVVHMREFTLYSASLQELAYYVASLDVAVAFLAQRGGTNVTSDDDDDDDDDVDDGGVEAAAGWSAAGAHELVNQSQEAVARDAAVTT